MWARTCYPSGVRDAEWAVVALHLTPMTEAGLHFVALATVVLSRYAIQPGFS